MNTKKPSGFIVILIIQTVLLIIYTGFAIKNEGWGLLSIFMSNISSLTWNGQFNLDFSCYLLLSGIWILWRNQYSVKAIVLAIAAMTIGIMVFAPYLIYLTYTEKGDLKFILLGKNL
jgi:hypothetical protein